MKKRNIFMWAYKLVTESGNIYYYDYDELEIARNDRITYGGTLFDRKGKIL